MCSSAVRPGPQRRVAQHRQTGRRGRQLGQQVPRRGRPRAALEHHPDLPAEPQERDEVPRRAGPHRLAGRVEERPGARQRRHPVLRGDLAVLARQPGEVGQGQHRHRRGALLQRRHRVAVARRAELVRAVEPVGRGNERGRRQPRRPGVGVEVQAQPVGRVLPVGVGDGPAVVTRRDVLEEGQQLEPVGRQGRQARLAGGPLGDLGHVLPGGQLRRRGQSVGPVHQDEPVAGQRQPDDLAAPRGDHGLVDRRDPPPLERVGRLAEGRRERGQLAAGGERPQLRRAEDGHVGGSGRGLWQNLHGRPGPGGPGGAAAGQLLGERRVRAGDGQGRPGQRSGGSAGAPPDRRTPPRGRRIARPAAGRWKVWRCIDTSRSVRIIPTTCQPFLTIVNSGRCSTRVQAGPPTPVMPDADHGRFPGQTPDDAPRSVSTRMEARDQP